MVKPARPLKVSRWPQRWLGDERCQTAAQTLHGELRIPHTSATNWAYTAEGRYRTGPSDTFESRTGTMPCVATRLVATSTQLPPLLLYEDVNQRGDGDVDAMEVPLRRRVLVSRA
ncbi:hypothetical protein SF12_09120 [Streptomyces sp. MBRL 601]|nr:hypothetical protein SF12_09120 [Streptomyces sp. MBRL 601]